jgi:hypothetical protein
MHSLMHPLGSDSATRQKIQEIKLQISRILVKTRGKLAAEQEMLDAAPAAFHQGVTPSSGGWRSGDAHFMYNAKIGNNVRISSSTNLQCSGEVDL